MSSTYPTTPRIERKVKASAYASYLALLALLAVLQGVTDLDMVTFLPDWLETVALPALPAVIGTVAGYAARHAPRPDLSPTQR